MEDNLWSHVNDHYSIYHTFLDFKTVSMKPLVTESKAPS